MSEFKLDKNGEVIETFGDVMAVAKRALKKSKRRSKPEPEERPDIHCADCFHYEACCDMVGAESMDEAYYGCDRYIHKSRVFVVPEDHVIPPNLDKPEILQKNFILSGKDDDEREN